MSRIKEFVKSELTLCIAFLAAAVSCIFVPPDGEYLGYIDLRTLALLYCLMVVVAGLRRAGAFDVLSHALCSKAGTARTIALLLVLLCFFSALFVTNDVALLTFVPFAVAVLGFAHQEKQLIWVVVLQTVAANLGSMLTPVGNPQNLYLYSRYDMDIWVFLRITVPIWAISLIMVCLLCLPVPPEKTEIFLGEKPQIEKKTLALYLALFAACLAVVFRLVEWWFLLAFIVLVLMIFDRKRLRDADFLLLLTFVCFFLFSGNLSRITAVDELLRKALSGRELLVGAGLSQIISNVPAALLLSSFTDKAEQLLLGVNIGGLGTPVASLASLISLKLYSHSEHADMGKFMGVFMAVNLGLLVFLLAIVLLFPEMYM